MKIPKNILLLVIALVMLNNVEHLALVHYTIAQRPFPILAFDWVNKAHSTLVVIIFEIVIITFVLAGKKGFSIFFTWCLFILSMIYYDAPGLMISARHQDLVAATVYSTIYSISIYMFSEMLAQWYHEQRMDQFAQKKIDGLRADLSEAREGLKQSATTITKLEASQIELQQLRVQLKQYEKEKQVARERLTCPFCHTFQAETEGQLRSHKGHCPDNPKNLSSNKQ